MSGDTSVRRISFTSLDVEGSFGQRAVIATDPNNVACIVEIPGEAVIVVLKQAAYQEWSTFKIVESFAQATQRVWPEGIV